MRQELLDVARTTAAMDTSPAESHDLMPYDLTVHRLTCKAVLYGSNAGRTFRCIKWARGPCWTSGV